MTSQTAQMFDTSSSGGTSDTNETESGSGGETTVGQRDMGKEEFLSLLVSQLKNQNPMKPMENKEFMAQMAQFNSLQQMQSLNSTMEKFIGYQKLTQAGSLVGKKVKVLDSESGDTITGTIEKINMSDSPTVQVNGKEYAVGNIQEVLSGE